ncbi:MAG TPA: OmpA family protein [Nannocystaceae bacterium]|nr:OmpA family protein [Nannocystaceae bacterium]
MSIRTLLDGRRIAFVAALAWAMSRAPEAFAAEPDEEITDEEEPASDEEAAPSDDEATDDELPVPEGSEPDEASDKKSKRDKKSKQKKADKKKSKKKKGKDDESSDEEAASDDEKAEDLPELPVAPDRTTGKAAIKYERQKPWIKRWAPERNMLDLGVSIGALFVPRNYALFDAGTGTRPSMNRAGFDFGFRAAFMPLSFLGFGVEFGPSGNHSSSARANATVSVFRIMVLGQLPYRITPTLAIGGGLIGVQSKAAILNQVDGAFHWGLGLKAYINQWIAVRIDGRHIVTKSVDRQSNVSYGELLFGVDVTLRFRRILKSRRSDRDDDGWLDKDDKCPTEPGDDVGCPEDKDSDGDGVPDKIDRCPKQKGDGARGCPVPDSDDDGIYDNKDDCADQAETRNGFQDSDGCPDEAPAEVKKLTGVMKGITFDSGTATIRKSSRKLLDEVVSTMQTHTSVRLEITGHTDDQGKPESNIALSSQRADAVKAYLVSKGIEGGRITTKGAGQEQPIADNKTKAGRAANRRIEFRVIE